MAHADFLARHSGSLGVRLNQYDTDRFNLLVNQAKGSLMGGNVELQLAGSKWAISLEANPISSDEIECIVTFHCMAGILMDAGVEVDLEIADWSVNNYVLMPAAVYDGNRFPSRRIPYSPKLCFEDDIGPDKPIIVEVQSEQLCSRSWLLFGGPPPELPAGLADRMDRRNDQHLPAAVRWKSADAGECPAEL